MIVSGVKCYSCSWFPFKKDSAIVLFGKVIFNCTKEHLENIYSNKQMLQVLNHKRIHILQGEALGWIVFYTFYLYYYLKNRIDFDRHGAYLRIPFELEAYENERDFTYKTTVWEYYC